MTLSKALAAALLLLGLVASSLFANIEITLKNDFIEKYKDQATISASFIVDKAHPHPNPPKNDGDLHAAGRAESLNRLLAALYLSRALVRLRHGEQGGVESRPMERTAGMLIRLAREHAHLRISR